MAKQGSLLEFQFENSIVIPDAFPLSLMLEDAERKKLYERYREEADRILFRGTYDRLAEDIYFSFYNRSLQIRDRDFIKLRFLANHQILEDLVAEDSHKGLREGPSSTIYNKPASFIALLVFLEDVLKKLRQNQTEAEQKQRSALDDEMQGLQERRDSAGEGTGDEEQAAAEEELRTRLTRALEESREKTARAVAEALKETREHVEDTEKTLRSIFGGPFRGFGEGELQKLPIHQRIELAKKLRGAEKLRQIVSYLGRFRIIAARKQVEKRTGAPLEPTDVRKGSDLDNLLPEELQRISGNDVTRLDFIGRLVGGSLLEFELQNLKQKENLGKGSIIVCVDTSGSMGGEKELKAKALALAIADIAYHEKRNFACILFSSKSEVEVIRFAASDPVDALAGKVIDLAARFYNGGTDFESPLDAALRIIEEDQFTNADIVFVTDGYADVGPDFLARYKELKRRKQFHVVGLLCDATDADRAHGLPVLQSFCDEVKYNSTIEKDLSFNAADDWADDLFLKI